MVEEASVNSLVLTVSSLISIQQTTLGFVCDHFDEGKWLKCMAFFRISPDHYRDTSFRIRGFSRLVFGYQLFAVYLMLQMERRTGGGFLGDEMGLGKTTEMILYLHVRRLLNEAWRAVELSRQNQTSLHLSADILLDQDVQCPSASSSIIQCPCVPGGVSAALEPKYGAALILVPPSLLQNWVKEWHACFGSRSNSLRCIIGHGGQHGLDNVHRVRTVLQSPSRSHHSHLVVLTTRQSYRKQVFDVLKETVETRVPGKKAGTTKKGITERCATEWGCVVRDEFHQEYQPGAQVFRDIQHLRGHPYLWFLSGTPYTNHLADLCSHVRAIQQHHPWTQPPLNRFTLEYIKRLSHTFEKWAGQPEGAQEFQICTQHVQAFLRAVMIRRLANLEWFNKPIVSLPPLFLHRKPCAKIFWNRHENRVRIEEIHRALRRQIEDAREQGVDHRSLVQQVIGSKTYYVHRILATFPALVQLYHMDQYPVPENNRVELTGQQIYEKQWESTHQQDSPYWRFRDRIWAQSAKLLALESIIRRLIHHQHDSTGRPAQLLIISTYPVISLLVDWWIRARYPDLPVSRIGPPQSMEQRQELVDTFQEDNTGSLRILIGSAKILGVGYTCTRALGLVLMEPLRWHDIQQACRRICRYGQQNPHLRCYILYTKGEKVEELVLRNAARQKILVYFEKHAIPPDPNDAANHPAAPDTEQEGDQVPDYDQDDEGELFAVRAIQAEEWEPPTKPLPLPPRKGSRRSRLRVPSPAHSGDDSDSMYG